MARTKRREREIEWVRSNILEAAAQVFARKGYHGATMEEIARLAGYSPAALYTYYRSKTEVFRALHESITGRLFGFLAPSVDLPFPEQLARMMQQTFEFAEDHRDFFLSMMRHPHFDHQDQAELHEAICDFNRRYTVLLAELMQRGMELGVLREGNASNYATALLGLMNAFFFRWLRVPDHPGLREEVTAILELFLHGAARSVLQEAGPRPAGETAGTAQPT